MTEIEQIKKWIIERNAQVTDIEPDTDIIENRLIDSLAFVEFIILVAQLSGKDIDMDTVDVEHFRTLQRISEEYFGAGVL